MLKPTDASSTNKSDNPIFQPMGFGDILDTTFSLYRKHFLLFLGILTLYFLGILVEYTLESILPAFPLKRWIVERTDMPFTLVSIGGIILATATTYLNRHITSSDALKQTFRRFMPILVCHILSILAWGFPLILASIALRQGVGLTLAILLIGTPFSIYFAVRWVFVTTIVLLEKSSGPEAFKRSSNLVLSTWWRVFGMGVSILLLSVAIYYIFKTSLGFILSLTKLAGETVPQDIIQWVIMDEPLNNSSLLLHTIMTSIDILLRVLTTPIWVIGITLLYFDLRVRKEGFDIEAQIDNSNA